jgi:hypothetical protein
MGKVLVLYDSASANRAKMAALMLLRRTRSQESLGHECRKR